MIYLAHFLSGSLSCSFIQSKDSILDSYSNKIKVFYTAFIEIKLLPKRDECWLLCLVFQINFMFISERVIGYVCMLCCLDNFIGSQEKHPLWSSKKLYWTKKMKSITVRSIDVSLFVVSLCSAQIKVVDFKYHLCTRKISCLVHYSIQQIEILASFLSVKVLYQIIHES